MTLHDCTIDMFNGPNALRAMLHLSDRWTVSGTMAVDSTVYASPLSGTEVHSIPEWLTDMAGGDVSNATIGGGKGCLISIIGLLISFVAVLIHMRDGSSP